MMQEYLISIRQKKIYYGYNRLQIEKSIRKKQFLPIIKNKIDAVFVSKYLERITLGFITLNQDR